MNKALLLSLVLFCCGLQMQAQTLTEAEVTAKMNEAFVLNNAKKTAEALDAFLLVGKNTEQQRNEVEHQVYVCSQAMACMCYETLKRYEEAYQLAKKLMSGGLTEKEKKDVGGQLQKSVDALGGGLTKIYCQVVYEERNKVCTFAT